MNDYLNNTRENRLFFVVCFVFNIGEYFLLFNPFLLNSNKHWYVGKLSSWNTFKLWDKKENMFCRRLIIHHRDWRHFIYTLVQGSQARLNIWERHPLMVEDIYVFVFDRECLRAMYDWESWRRPWKRWKAWLLILACKILAPLVPVDWLEMTWPNKANSVFQAH